jgi:hypothetical protein
VTVTKLTAAGAVVLLGFLCWLAAAGFTAMRVVLVSGAVLVVLVAGGNWIGGRSTPRSPPVGPVSDSVAARSASGSAPESDPSVPDPSPATSATPATPQTPEAPESADGSAEPDPAASSHEPGPR